MPALDLFSTRYREGTLAIGRGISSATRKNVSLWNRSLTQSCVVSLPLTPVREMARHAVGIIQRQSCRTT